MLSKLPERMSCKRIITFLVEIFLSRYAYLESTLGILDFKPVVINGLSNDDDIALLEWEFPWRQSMKVKHGSGQLHVNPLTGILVCKCSLVSMEMHRNRWFSSWSKVMSSKSIPFSGSWSTRVIRVLISSHLSTSSQGFFSQKLLICSKLRYRRSIMDVNLGFVELMWWVCPGDK